MFGMRRGVGSGGWIGVSRETRWPTTVVLRPRPDPPKPPRASGAWQALDPEPGRARARTRQPGRQKACTPDRAAVYHCKHTAQHSHRPLDRGRPHHMRASHHPASPVRQVGPVACSGGIALRDDRSAPRGPNVPGPSPPHPSAPFTRSSQAPGPPARRLPPPPCCRLRP